MSPDDHLRALGAAQDVVDTARGEYERAVEDRDEAVRSAVRDGMPVGQVAAAVRTSRQRVYAIIR